MTADTIGGVWTYAMELARALESFGIEVGVAALGGRPNFVQKAEAASIENLTLFESAFKLEWMSDCRADMDASGKWLLELERSFKPGVVHLNNFAPGSLPWSCPKLVAGHSCVLSWWRAVRGGEAPAAWDDYRECVMTGLQAADLVVAPSRTMLHSLERDYGPFRAAQVIHNGRQLPSSRSRFKHDLVFAAGRLWDEGKNISALAEAAENLQWPVLVAGPEQDPEGNIVRYRNVSCLGKLSPSEMNAALERAAIYALPARYEPFGLSALEAALKHCALVLGDIPSLREIWGDAALFVNPGNPAELRALSRLIDDSAERSRLADAAFERAQRYTPQAMAESYVAAYARLMSQAETTMQANVVSTPLWEMPAAHSAPIGSASEG